MNKSLCCWWQEKVQKNLKPTVIHWLANSRQQPQPNNTEQNLSRFAFWATTGRRSFYLERGGYLNEYQIPAARLSGSAAEAIRQDKPLARLCNEILEKAANIFDNAPDQTTPLASKAKPNGDINDGIRKTEVQQQDEVQRTPDEAYGVAEMRFLCASRILIQHWRSCENNSRDEARLSIHEESITLVSQKA